jgi:hypothetical protein
MVNYIYIDNKNVRKSIAEFDGVQYEFWQLLLEEYSQEEAEAYIKAEVLLFQGKTQEAIDVATPFISGENTIQKTNELIDGVLTTVIVGEDTRSLLKKWYDNNF